MRSEFQFFIHEDDHNEFVELIQGFEGASISSGSHYDEINFIDGFIQYERCKIKDGIFTAGRIAIATTDIDGAINFNHYQEIEALYKNLRNWLKKRCTNKLVVCNEYAETPVFQPTKNYWISQNALNYYNENPIKLKQYATTAALFKPA